MSKILIACEFSGIVREAFRKKGHDAWSCDLLDTEIPGQHIKGDVLEILNDGWDLMIAHTPCTYTANSGVRWLYEIPGRFGKLNLALIFWKKLRNAPIELIAMENPIPHKYAKIIMGNYSQIIQPWMFGHGYRKDICLWLKNLPLLQPTNIVSGRELLDFWSDKRLINGKSQKSIMFKGVAEAMAEQWGQEIYHYQEKLV